ncbi:Carboxy-terminal domain (CTD) phosphatase [Globomyces sp. JEL0801]|nr:Carboxy-terminal domain (CTD) phosphatase [Globomyces sp. JEL0801]
MSDSGTGTHEPGLKVVNVDASHYPLQIINWTDAKEVDLDQEIGRYEYLDDSNKTRRGIIMSNCKGIIENQPTVLDLIESIETPICFIREPCSHAVQLHGLCALCGQDLTRVHYSGFSQASRATINLTHDSKGVTVSTHEAGRIDSENITRLLNTNMLTMLLDLDQTVIHATVDTTVKEWLSDPDNPDYPTLKLSALIHYRPGTREFLEEMYNLYEMHIYTMGTRNYAFAVANILDPTKKYFKDRILSRDDSGSFVHKSIQRLFPVDQSMVVAIDDRSDVWNWSPSLIKVRPYNFFIGIGDINEPLKENSSIIYYVYRIVEPIEKDEKAPKGPKPKPKLCDDDAELEYLIKSLKNLHKQFFDHYKLHDTKNDIGKLLPSLKSRVLEGVHLVFSGLIQIRHDPSTHDLWILATQFGAKCYKDLNDQVTHVVATKKGTIKVNQAKDKDIWIVKPEWLIDSLSQWEKLKENDYLLDSSILRLVNNDQMIPVNMVLVNDDWNTMDKEVDEALLDSDDSEDTEELQPTLKPEIEQQSLSLKIESTDDDDDGWLNDEIDDILNNSPTVASVVQDQTLNTGGSLGTILGKRKLEQD